MVDWLWIGIGVGVVLSIILGFICVCLTKALGAYNEKQEARRLQELWEKENDF